MIGLILAGALFLMSLSYLVLGCVLDGLSAIVMTLRSGPDAEEGCPASPP